MILNSEQETINFATKFASTLKGGEVVCLNGNLGAGKTTFMKGVAEYFGINKDEIISPTFIIANIINIKNPKFKIKNIIHIDAYRINNPDNMLETGVLEFFEKQDIVVFVEWAENIEKYIPKNKITINIEIKDKEKRVLEVI